MDGYVGLYCRISRDRAGRVEGVGRQEQWGRDYAARTWPGTPVVVFSDNNLSAADGDVVRPGYDELRASVRAGRLAHLWTVEQSRLERTEVGWFSLAAELDAAGIDEVHTDRDGVVRARDEVAGIKAVIAAGEARRIKRRVMDTLGSLADEGRPGGGFSFGYRPGTDQAGRKTLDLVAAEADEVRLAASRVLAGWSLANIVADLEARGIPTKRGGRWSPTTVRSFLTSPMTAGLRTWQGQVVRKGTWEPILDEATWRQVGAILAGPRLVIGADGKKHAVRGKRRAGRRYLLTGGLARCARCGAALIAAQRTQRRRRLQPGYYCYGRRGGCNGIGITAEPLEGYVVERLFAKLDDPVFLAAVAADDQVERRAEIERELAELDEQDVVLMRRWRGKRLSERAWDEAQAAVDEDRRRLTAELAAAAPAAFQVDAGAVREGWEGLTFDERRYFVRLYVGEVTVGPATLGTRKFDPGRVTIIGVDREHWD